MPFHVHVTQNVISKGRKVLARICRHCLVVLCKDCGARVFVADHGRESQMCKCREVTVGAR
jgi:hypothetical protein